MQTKPLEYSEDGKLLRGFLAWNQSATASRPGILVFHENTGLTDFEKERATRLAALGYVALAADLFGQSVLPATATDAERRSAFEEFRSKKMVPRARAALNALAAQPDVDPNRIAAIGFCLGGTSALELARSGAGLTGVVSFHGGLATQQAAAPGSIKSKILICHGASDPFIPFEQVAAFAKEMQDAGVDWQIVFYGGAMHGFTNPAADRHGRPGVAYHEPSDNRSWLAMQQFLTELFLRP